ncbi:3-hydroxyacyl-CoA dehydrogenase [Paracoccus sediminicola]|uniref:3-hydroxyacyl-CoA dehydrogenase n=1 Tax=Paracoccus sediminicola TaxID=3017783 RepID=UPI0022EFE9E8|nr:3-hydroxyacyl-CoA dehydrogenase [Paracoccus sediminicola]WBU56538.1 3-hydroxyacyl-CoA dehydrogenase [Paracoccus sediminicola]
MTEHQDRPVIAIIGAGLIGRGWSIVFARAGLPVRIWDPDAGLRRALPARIAEMLRAVGMAEEVCEQISVFDSLADALSGASYVQENGPEKLEVKQALFAEMDGIAAPDTVLASSSSALVASRFGEGLKGRARILVAHPVNPPHLVPVVELCPSPDTAPEVMDRAEALHRRVGQVPVRMSREIDGFILNRLQAVVLAEAMSLIGQGIVSVEGLDDTMRHGLGRRWTLMGPLETIYLNAPAGVPDYLERYGPMMAGLADSAARGEAFTAQTAERLAAAFPPADHVPERSAQRDAKLAALDRHLRRYDTED